MFDSFTTNNNDIFNESGKALIDVLLCGYNCAIISYGPQQYDGPQSILFGQYTYDIFNFDIQEMNIHHNYCLIGDDGIYQQCIKYLFKQLQLKKINKKLINWEIQLTHIYTYPDMKLLNDALVNKHGNYELDARKKSKRETFDDDMNKKPLNIKSRKAFGDPTDTKIFVENARSVNINNYDDIKNWWQIGHDNIFYSQLEYAKTGQHNEAKSNYYEYRNSINQIITIDLNQYFNDGTIFQSNVKFIIPRYYYGANGGYQNVLSNSLPLSNYHKSAQLSRAKSDNFQDISSPSSSSSSSSKTNGYVAINVKPKSDWKKNYGVEQKDPLYTVCNALSYDSMIRRTLYQNSYLTHLCKDVLGGNCKTLFVVSCSTNIQHRLETLKCLEFCKTLKRIHCNPKINKQSIQEWSQRYNDLKRKYDKLENELNAQRKRRVAMLNSMTSKSKSAGNSPANKFENNEFKYDNNNNHNDNNNNNKEEEEEYRDDRRVIYQGYLHKEGGVIKSVKIRYFVLFEKGQLAYYDDATSKNSIGVIDVKHDFKSIELFNWIDDDKSANFNGFILTTKTSATKQRKWKLGTASINVVNHWIKVLKKAGGRNY